MSAKNSNLRKAKTNKNDEFYTQLTDVSKELKHYRKHFKGKTVFCNCDDPTWSAFWKYFHLNFEVLGLKKLISTHYDKDEPTYKMVYEGGNDNNIEVGIKTPLQGNGDFRNQECIELLKESDIVVTNPPFSLFREYVAQLMEYQKGFLIIGNQNAIAYKEIFPLIKSNKIWWGATDCVRWFVIPNWVDMKYKINKDGERIAEGARSRWYTNLDHKKRQETLCLWKEYNPEEYPKYDNYDAINVNKTEQIPKDYDGYMGVPITFLDKYNPNQFEILGFTNTGEENKGIRHIDSPHGRALIGGKEIYTRILIRKK